MQPMLNPAANMKQQFIGFVNRSAMVWFVLLVIAVVILIIMSITVAVQKGMINRRNVTIAVEQSKADAAAEWQKKNNKIIVIYFLQLKLT